MCFVVWLTAAAVWADEVTNSLPQSLSRVTLLANLKAGDYYAVLKNMNKENYELLGTHYAFKEKGCMAAGKRAEPTDKLEASMTVKTAKELWQLTVNMGSKATDPEWQAQFAGATDIVSVTKDGGTIEAITGSTITSRAVCDGVNAARAVVEALG